MRAAALLLLVALALAGCGARSCDTGYGGGDDDAEVLCGTPAGGEVH